MDIRLFVTEGGQIALTCHDSVFSQPVAGVELDMLSTMLSIRLEDREDAIPLNCPVDYNMIEFMKAQEICTVGFYLGEKLAGAMYVPFTIANNPDDEGVYVQ